MGTIYASFPVGPACALQLQSKVREGLSNSCQKTFSLFVSSQLLSCEESQAKQKKGTFFQSLRKILRFSLLHFENVRLHKVYKNEHVRGKLSTTTSTMIARQILLPIMPFDRNGGSKYHQMYNYYSQSNMKNCVG